MTNNFLFHEVSEKEREEIRKEAKGIMDSFAKKLGKVKLPAGEPMVVRHEGERKEGNGKCEDISREIMFSNALNSNDDFIVGEKGGWSE